MDTPAAASDGQRRSPRIQEIAARTSPSAPSASITAATAPSTAAPANAERPSSASTGNGSPASSAAAPVAPPSSSEPIAGASGVQKAPRRRPDHDPRIKNSVNVGKRMPVAPVEDDEEEEDSEEEDAEEEEEDEDDQEEEDPQPPAKRRRTGGTSATSVAAEPAVAGVFCEGSVAYFDTTNAVLVETPTQTFVSGQWHGRFLMPVSNFRGADLSGIPIAGPTHPDRRLPVWGDVEEKNRALYERHMEKVRLYGGYVCGYCYAKAEFKPAVHIFADHRRSKARQDCIRHVIGKRAVGGRAAQGPCVYFARAEPDSAGIKGVTAPTKIEPLVPYVKIAPGGNNEVVPHKGKHYGNIRKE